MQLQRCLRVSERELKERKEDGKKPACLRHKTRQNATCRKRLHVEGDKRERRDAGTFERSDKLLLTQLEIQPVQEILNYGFSFIITLLKAKSQT